MSGGGYVWDELYPDLAARFGRPWGEPLVGTNRRQDIATPLAMRALRRGVIVDTLFKSGHYWECHTIVRSAYEDWLQIAHLMALPGNGRCDAYALEIRKHDARVYDAFRSLCGEDAADRLFHDIPSEVAQFIGLPRRQTNPPSFAALADDVGLRAVHDFVYTYLSGRSHPTGRIQDLFDESTAIAVARIPVRDVDDELRLALWMGWFTGRILAIGAREFGVDHEDFCEQFLVLSAATEPNLETCVFVRES